MWLLLWTLTSFIFAVSDCGNHPPSPPKGNDSLVLLHVLFRHGNRTANGPEELYPKDPYVNKTYFPFGLGQLTNTGKVRELSIGKGLRARYNKFLGDYYYPTIVEPTSTDFNRTKMSLLLVLAGLFPPRDVEIWHPAFLNWQPVPYNYLPTSRDTVLVGQNCPNYIRLYDQQTKSLQQQAEFTKYRSVFDYISKNTGLNVTTFKDVYDLYFGLSTEEEMGFVLPPWTRTVWPKEITNLAIREYFVATATTELRKMASGYLLQKILSDTQLKLSKISSGKDDGRKIYIYSAHENNVAQLLVVLGIFDPPHVPTYGSYITMEVHRINGSDKYGIKIYYENYTTNKPQLLKLPACDTICEITKFSALVEEYMPDKDTCGKRGQNETDNKWYWPF